MRTLAELEAALREVDLVVLGAEHAAKIHERAPAEAHLPLRRPDATAVLLGTTRDFWPRFLAERERGTLDPLDRLVERLTHETLTRLFGGDGYGVVFSHVVHPAPYPFQRLAEEFGLPRGRHGLTLHPTFGSWFALRAVATVPPLEFSAPSPRGSPCDACPAPCRKLAPSLTLPDLSVDLRLALAARESCPEGAPFRYDRAALGYHYTKDSIYLEMETDSE